MYPTGVLYLGIIVTAIMASIPPDIVTNQSYLLCTHLSVEVDLLIQKVLHHFSKVDDPFVLKVVDFGWIGKKRQSHIRLTEVQASSHGDPLPRTAAETDSDREVMEVASVICTTQTHFFKAIVYDKTQPLICLLH